VNVLYHFSIQCYESYFQRVLFIVQYLYLVLKCIIVPFVIYFKLMTNLRLFINYEKHGVLLLFVISYVYEKINSEFFLLQSVLLFASSLFEGREIPAAVFSCISLSKEKKEVFLS